MGPLAAKHDLEVNVKAEKEIEVILQHLEYQNSLLIKLTQNLKIDVSAALDKLPSKKR